MIKNNKLSFTASKNDLDTRAPKILCALQRIDAERREHVHSLRCFCAHIHTHAHDQMHLISQAYVMSNHLVASYLAMVSEDRAMNSIYSELLSCRGSEVQIRRISDFARIDPTEELSFWDIVGIARGQDELVLGYIIYRGGRGPQRGLSLDATQNSSLDIRLNPNDKSVRRCWHPEDRLILVALSRRARVKKELKRRRAEAEAEVTRTMLSGAVIHGWLKKLGAGFHRAVDMDDERRQEMLAISCSFTWLGAETRIDPHI